MSRICAGLALSSENSKANDMPKLQSRLTIALLFTMLAIITFFVTAFISGPIDFLYRNAAGLGSARNIAEIVALVALVVLFIAGFIITIPVALQPARLIGKIGKVLPAYLLLFALVAIVSALIGVGQVGNLFNIQGVGQVTFIAAWLGLAAIISTIAVVIAAARAPLSASALKSAARITVAGSALTAVATVAMLASVVIVSTSTPATFGGPGGNRSGGAGQTATGQNGGNRPNGRGQSPEATGEVPSGAPNGQKDTPSGQQPEATGEPQGSAAGGNGIVLVSAPVQIRQQPEATVEPQTGAPNGQNGGQGQRPEGTAEAQGGVPGRQNGGGAPEGFPPGGGPGGPGGGSGNIVGRYAIGGALMTIFAVIGLIGGISSLSAARQVPTTAWASPVLPNYPREAGLALVTGIGITIVVLAVIQLVPVTRDNPPVKTPINWDSEQTKTLVYNTCMDCHSNETTWPWYASIAPASWLNTMHVHDARAEMNLSDLDSMPAFQRRSLANNMANQIKSGSMPPKDYLLLHPDARLTDAQKEELIQGLQKSLGGS